ncbi:acyl-CoA dehydrogenase family protein [Bradyrhizobium sp. dw_78]|uniref:acyl-CoA dehydrogenase family protein n=1 Tax=Bradyrhizobium sp. dw_78 TaxID=2719793 RepID=UPI001BD4C120|nr:acyl-CoA dehydrogenase family protein [Bradyrhizobium sp. dw_78]
MDFYRQYDSLLSSDELSFVEKARAFCTGAFSDHLLQAHIEGIPFAREWISRWAALGMFGLQAQRDHGGLGASFLCKVRVAQEMAQHGFAAAFCLNHHQGSVTRLSQTGTPAQAQRLLPDALRGERLYTIAMTEPGGGSDAAGMSTIATRVPDGWRLNGSKSWLTDGLIVDGLILLARAANDTADDGVASFYVTLDDAATFSRREIMVPGARSFRLAEITFKDHFIPDWAMIAAPGQALKASMATINAARVHVAAMCVATLRASLAEAVAYCQERHTFGKSLLQHQGLRWELANVATRLEAANALVYRAAELIQRGETPVTLAAQCKAFAVETAIWGVDQCIRAIGATGASSAHRLNMHLAEMRMAAYADGTNEMLFDRIGKGLAADYPLQSAAH